MIQDFDEIKTQLSQLSTVINSFKSEAVQLRLVELIFHSTGKVNDLGHAHGNDPDLPPKKKRKRTSSRKTNSAAKNQPNKKLDKSTTGKRKVASRPGAVTLLQELIDEGFFKKPRIIQDIIDHLDSAKARRFKANELSGRLVRFTREKYLSRAKNKDGQYEYTA